MHTSQRERCLQLAVTNKAAAIEIKTCSELINMINLSANLLIVSIVVRNITTSGQTFMIN